MNHEHKKAKRRRIIALLSREEMEFIDKLGLDSLFSTGHKLSRVAVISALLDAAMAMNLTGKGVHNKAELVQSMLGSLKDERDRRKYPRLNKHLHVRFRKMDSMSQYEKTATDDMSLGGFSIEAAFAGRPLLLNDVVEASINAPQEKGEPIKAIGRVAWVKQKENNHCWELGIALTYIKEEDKERYFKYLAEEAEINGGK